MRPAMVTYRYIFVLLIGNHFCRAEVFSCIATLKTLVEHERYVLPVLERVITSHPEQTGNLSRWVVTYSLFLSPLTLYLMWEHMDCILGI